MNISELIRPNIRTLKPYTSARDLYADGKVLLDANENAFGSVVGREGLALHRYPDPHQLQLRESLGNLTGIPTQNLFFGVGSDEIIDLLMRIFCEPGRDSIAVFEPTYGMYRVSADIQNIGVVELGMDESFQPILPDEGEEVMKSVKLIFVCSPNNPTGNCADRQRVLQLCRAYNAIVVVDEAYIDFAPESSSFADAISELPNLVVMRTFSKAWGLAGIRAGYCIADAVIINTLFSVKAPYSMNVLTESVLLEALQKSEEVKQNIARLLDEKKILAKKLKMVIPGITIYPSDANYLLVRFDGAREIQKALARYGIIIRDRSSQRGLENCLRITVGTAEENILLMDTLQKLLQEQKA